MSAAIPSLIYIPANFKTGAGHVIVSRATLDSFQRGSGLILVLVPIGRHLAVLAPAVRKHFDIAGCDTTLITFEGQTVAVFIPSWRHSPPLP